MDLRTGQRTFYQGVSGVDDGEIIEIPFLDTAGNVINCSYINITTVLQLLMTNLKDFTQWLINLVFRSIIGNLEFSAEILTIQKQKNNMQKDHN